LSTENSQEPNLSETSHPVESTQPLGTSQTQPDVELVNPNILISRQTPSEMSGSKVKRLRKKIHEKGFDPEQPIEVADVDGKLIILDGHHRVAAARQLRLKSVPIRRMKVSPAQEDQLLLSAAEAEKYRQY